MEQIKATLSSLISDIQTAIDDFTDPEDYEEWCPDVLSKLLTTCKPDHALILLPTSDSFYSHLN